MTFVRFQVLLFRHTRGYNSRFLLRCSPKKTLHFLGAEKMDFAFERTVFFYGLTIRQVELHLRFTPEIGRLNSTICGTALRQLKSLSGDMQPRDLLRGHGADSTI